MSIFKQAEESKEIMSQDEAKNSFMPQIMSRGKDYAKFTEIKVRRAIPGELIVTITRDGIETQNTAKENDFVVTNLGGSREEYILTEDKLYKRYSKVEGEGDIWKAKGECKALEYTGEPMQFEASWGEAMFLKPGDMICSPLPDLNEVYRIARAEFDSTYALKENVTQANTILQKLASIADELDASGFRSEANCVDEVLLKLASYNAPRAGKKKKRWSVKYKKSIDCSNPKGFSQKQYCKRKRKGGDYNS
jgi:hypothetical protein